MKNIIAIIIMLFCGNAVAQECRSPAGTFEAKGVLLTSTCAGMPAVVDHGTIKLESTKCGARFRSDIQTDVDGCTTRMSVLSVFEEKSSYGFGVIEMSCVTKGKPAQQCQAVYKISFALKAETKGPIKQEADSE